MQNIILTKDEIEMHRPYLRDGIAAGIWNNSDGHISDAPKLSALIEIDVNDYVRPVGEDWDVDAWEARQGYIYAPATRENWKVCYRIARGFMKGPVTITDRDGMKLELPSITTINC